MRQGDEMATVKTPASEQFATGNPARAGTVKFSLAPTPPFRLGLAVWTLRRRVENGVDRWDGTNYRRILPLGGVPVEVAVAQTAPPESPQLRITVTGAGAGSAVKAVISPALERMLGLRADLSDFYRFAARDARLAALAERFRGMRPPRFPTVFEALINGIACQQMSLTLGIQLLNRLSEAYGLAWGEGETPDHAFPRPEDLAGIWPQALRPLGFSHQKSRAMIEAAQAVCDGQLDLESLVDVPDEEAVRRLEQLRGVGRWTAEYVLLRGLGRWHIFPGDDVGARNNLMRWLNLRKPLDYERVRRVLTRWRSYGGLIYFHLLLDRLATSRVLP
jgi:DNA-3-methyladenine glycosylase II